MKLRRPNREARRAELPAAGETTVRIAGAASVNPAGFTLVATWTASAGRYYYDLEHKRGRAIVLLQMYDRVRNNYLAEASEYQPLPGSETSTLRIWLNWDPGADRIAIMYL
jgi:hypothetical protein